MPGVFPGLATQQQKQQQGQCQPVNAYCVRVRNYGGAVCCRCLVGFQLYCTQLRGPLKTEQSRIKTLGYVIGTGKHSSTAGLGFGWHSNVSPGEEQQVKELNSSIFNAKR